MCKKKVYYEVLTEEGHNYFTDDTPAFNIFVHNVRKNKNCAVDRIILKKRLFRKPIMIKENILDFEKEE